jgi:rare lipoprotein A (peptidoglycan hydrolase)
VIDLSEAAAKYLGVGVSWVRAEILVPVEQAPG